jgi:hypothetical protein
VDEAKTPPPCLSGQRGQTTPEYMGVILIVAAVLAAIAVTPLGQTIGENIEAAICRIAGEDCEPQRTEVVCPVRTTTATDKLTVGVSVKLFSGEGSGERVVIKEEFSDGTARYTIVDRAQLDVALGERGAGAGVLGVGGSLTARLAATGALESAEVYETSNADETAQIDEALEGADGLEGAVRGTEGAFDAPRDAANWVIPFVDPLPDVDGFIVDQIFGDMDLPEPDAEYIGGDVGVDLSAGASADQGADEAGGDADLRAALGARRFMSGEREGEIELYYRIEGSAGVELKSAILGEANAGASGEVIATLVLGPDGRPKALRLNGTGTISGRNTLADSEIGLTSEDLRELIIDRDTSSGTTVEFTGELDLTDERNLAPVLELLNPNPVDQVRGAAGLVPRLAEGADVQYGIYDSALQEDTTDTNLVVVSVSTEDTTQVDTLRTLYRKPSGSLSFEQVDCGEGSG